MIKTCAHCKKEFKIVKLSQNNGALKRKYCSDECLKTATKLKQKNRYALKEEQEQRRKIIDTALDDILKEAQANKMSYGMYVASLNNL